MAFSLVIKALQAIGVCGHFFLRFLEKEYCVTSFNRKRPFMLEASSVNYMLLFTKADD